MTRTRLVAPLVAWTVFVWGTRIANIWADDALTSSGKWIRIVVAVAFLALAAAAAVVLRRRRGAVLGPSDRLVVGGFAVWTIGYWTVRAGEIILDDHSVGFTVVHTVLWLVSAALAVLALRVVREPVDMAPDRDVPASEALQHREVRG